MVRNTAITKLFSGNGEKLRATTWEKGRYIVANKDGAIVDNKGKSFNIMTAKEKTWELFKEPTPAITADNTELMNMIKTLTDEVKGLKEQVSNQEAPTVEVESDVNSYEVASEVVGSIGGEVEKAIKENMPQEDKNEETVKLFYGVSKLDEVRELFKEELTNSKDKRAVLKTLTRFIPYCWMSGRKVNTAIRYYTDLRNVIKEVGGDYQDLSLELFIMPQDVHERVKKINDKKVIDKLANRETFDISEMKSITTMLKNNVLTAISLGDEATIEDWKNNALPVAKQQKIQQARTYLYTTYLSLVTGRRITEILKNLEILEIDGKWFYKGLDKKNMDEATVEAFSLDTDFELLQQLVSQIRKDTDTTGMTNKQVNSKYNHIFNRAFKRITGTDFTFHDAREIYAEIAYIDFGKDNGTEREEMDFKADILGHEIDKDRLLATEHYMKKKGE